MGKTITHKCRISGGNLPDGIKGTFNLTIEFDVPEDNVYEAAYSSYRIDFQKIRDSITPEALKEMVAKGTVTVKASKLEEKKPRVTVKILTPDEIVAGILNGTIQVPDDKKAELVRSLTKK